MDLPHLDSLSGWIVVASAAVGIVLGAALKEAGKDAYQRLAEALFPKKSLPPSALPPGDKGIGATDSQVHQISPGEMEAALKAAPPLAQRDVSKRFEGIRIQWTGKFIKARHSGTDSYRLTTQVANTLVFLDVKASDYPELKSVHEGHPIAIGGTVQKVEDWGVDLKDAHIQLLAKNPAT